MQVPAFDITRQNERLAEPLAKAYQSVVSAGHFILGEAVSGLEAELAKYLQVDHAIAVANGSDALALALIALRIGPGDEVIVPGFTFFATAGAVARVGATPVFADVAESTYNLDPEQIRRRMTVKTKAVIPVHLFGRPADLREIMDLALEYNIAVIEDAAQSLGSEWEGRPSGTIGAVGCYSFFPTKNLGCFGDGGMVATGSAELAERLRMLRVHGARKKYYHELLGFNSRLDALQAAFLRVKLPYLAEWLERRRAIAAAYRQGLAGIPELTFPGEAEGHSYNQFTVIAADRDGLQQFLSERGIGATVYYPLGLHLQPVFQPLGYRPGDLPVTERLTASVLSLPLFPELTGSEADQVIDTIRQYYRR